MAPLKVLIVGGGIAGPALAHWLSRAGANITLIERSPQMRTSGQQIDLRAQGIPMMKKMGIEAAIRAACVHEPGTQLIDHRTAQTIAFFPATHGDTDGSAKQGITSEFEIMRGDVVRILYQLTEGRRNVRHLFDTTVEKLEDEKDSVRVHFRDGTTEDFDLVVGADGTGSWTRRMMLGPDAPDPRYALGGYLAFFSVPARPGDSDRATFTILPGGRVSRIIGTRKDCQELTRVYMMVGGSVPALDAALKSGDLGETKRALADLYEGGEWECGRFVDALLNSAEADDLYITPEQEVRLPVGSWSRGRVVLIGDAAHSQTANGYGCTYGLIGPYILAGEIAKRLQGKRDGPVTAALLEEAAKSYEEKFRPVAMANHGGYKWIDWSQVFERVFTSNIGISLVHNFAKMAAYFRIDQMGGLTSTSAKWQLPHYPELERDQGQ